jgi:hypothetical protein
MKEIKLTQNKVALVDDADFEYLNQWKWYATYKRNKWYARRTTSNPRMTIHMHRVIMKTPSNLEVDHIDHDSLNNQKHNLRNCSNIQNQRNQRNQIGCSSKYKGVSFNRLTGKWEAYINVNCRRIYLGLHKTELEAAKKYNDNAILHFGEFANINHIPNEEFHNVSAS